MIELDMTLREFVFGIGYDLYKLRRTYWEKDEPEIELDQVTGETLEVEK